VVFDCDGTLADTETLADRAWSEALTRHGYVATQDDLRAMIGHPFERNWRYFSSRVELGDPVGFRRDLRRRFLELFDSGVRMYEDALATLRALAEQGVAIAVASSSGRIHVDRVLDRGGIADLVDAIVSVDDVERPKPDPEPYLRAAELVGVQTQDCTAVEDTPVGVAAAKAAGMFTVAVVRAHHDAAELVTADRVVEVIDRDVFRRR